MLLESDCIITQIDPSRSFFEGSLAQSMDIVEDSAASAAYQRRHISRVAPRTPMDDSAAAASPMEALVSALVSGSGSRRMSLAESENNGAEAFVLALRRRFEQRSRGSQFHLLKTELSAAFEALPPAAAHAAVALVLACSALGSDRGDASGAAGAAGQAAAGAPGGDPEPEPELGKEDAAAEPKEGARARRKERLAKARVGSQRPLASAAAAATPLALILLEAIPPLSVSRGEDGALTAHSLEAMRSGVPVLRAVFDGQLPWLRPRVVLRIVDVYGLAEGGAPIDRAAAAEATKTQSGQSGGRTTRWRKPLEVGGKLLQWPSSVWACSADNLGGAANAPSHPELPGSESYPVRLITKMMISLFKLTILC